MMKFSTRVRIIIVTVITTALYWLTQNFNVSEFVGFKPALDFDLMRHVLIAVVVYLGTFWALDGKIAGERFITILLFPVLGVIAGSFFGEILINFINPGDIGQFTVSILSIIIVGSITYIVLLTVNILNINYYNTVPLGQAAKAAYFVISLVVAFIFFFILNGNEINFIIKLLSFIVITFLIVYMCLWSIEYSYKARFTVASSIAVIIGWGQLILAAWPVDALYLTLILNLIFYFALNMAMETREHIGNHIWMEYIALYVFIFVVLTILAEWGINGSLV